MPDIPHKQMTETQFWAWLRAKAYEYGDLHGIPRPRGSKGEQLGPPQIFSRKGELLEISASDATESAEGGLMVIFAEFQEMSLGQLAAITGIDRHRWSRYLSGKVSMTEKTLNKVATKLGMTASELLMAISQRRKSGQGDRAKINCY